MRFAAPLLPGTLIRRCQRFRPWDEVDPEYGHLLRRAVAAGVEALAYRAHVGPREIRLDAPLPMML